MRNLVPDNLLRLMIGHESAEMTEHYTRVNLAENLLAAKHFADRINSLFQ